MSDRDHLSPKPILGLSCKTCFGDLATEKEILDQAGFLSKSLSLVGWKNILIDSKWYASAIMDEENGLTIDAFGRPVPSENLFPSSTKGRGFKPHADFLHSKNMKLGIKIPIGVPIEAAKKSNPIWDSKYFVSQIINKEIVDPTGNWNGIDFSKPGAKDYINSIVKLLAEWGVDLVIFEEIAHSYQREKIEEISKSIQKTGANIAFGFSPLGKFPIDKADHVKRFCELWEIQKGPSDLWGKITNLFDITPEWFSFIGPGNWATGGIIPSDQVQSPLTKREVTTLVTLLAIFKSPLIYGGDFRKLREFTYSLLTNQEILHINQHSRGNRLLYKKKSKVVWAAESPDSGDIYLALFNLDDHDSHFFEVPLKRLHLHEGCLVKDLLNDTEIGGAKEKFVTRIKPHGSGLFSLRRMMDE